MAGTSLVAWFGWFLVLERVDPQETGAVGLALFYITLFAALFGTVSVMGALYRVFCLKRKGLVMREARISFRHGILLSLVAVSSLALSAQGMLTWLNILAIFTCISVVEYLFVSMEEHRRM